MGAREEGSVTDDQELFGEVQPDVRALAAPLFDISEKALRERGSFLPHAAALTAEGKIRLIGAMCNTSDGVANAAHILPLLRRGLRTIVHEHAVTAVGFAEDVTVTPEGQEATQAIKLHLEHSRGLTVEFYLPFAQGTSGEITFGSTLSMFAPPEINAWDEG
jgi:hypothetical protein